MKEFYINVCANTDHIINGLRVLQEKMDETFRSWTPNRRTKKAFRCADSIRYSWYMEDHKRRLMEKRVEMRRRA